MNLLSLRLIGVFWLAAGLDFLLADPWGWPHPVQAIGWVISRGKNWILQSFQSPSSQKVMGIVLGSIVIVDSGLVGASLVILGQAIHWGLGLGIATILLASCFAGRGLRRAADDVLSKETLTEARDRLRLYVGRDTDRLDQSGIDRAVFETVTENAIDGVLAPLFYAGLGAGLGAVVEVVLAAVMEASVGQGLSAAIAVALALAYKAASTLDSMVGYREAPYTHLGWFSARFEDYLTWLPCRTAVLCIALLSGHPQKVLQVCWRDARTDPSPNAGWSECVYAAALGVQVGGENYYRGVLKHKPLLGNDDRPITTERIHRALGLTRACFLIWLTGLTLLLLMI